MAHGRRSRFIGVLTSVNFLLLVANLVGGWFFLYWSYARPDGVVPAFIQWLQALWILGPVLSLSSVAIAIVSRGSSRHRWMNAGICAGYVLLWAFVLLTS
jgi:hypothetical protein